MVGKQLTECEDFSQTSVEDNRFVVFTPATETTGEKYNDYEVTGYLGHGTFVRFHLTRPEAMLWAGV